MEMQIKVCDYKICNILTVQIPTCTKYFNIS